MSRPVWFVVPSAAHGRAYVRNLAGAVWRSMFAEAQ
jgi:hypothetical protein